MNASHHSALPRGRLFCFGLGYTGSRLALALRARGWEVAGTSRDAEALQKLEAHGIRGFPFARSGPPVPTAAILSRTTHVLISVPPDAAGDAVIARHAGDIAGAEGIAWLGYLSTTGVYGDRGGAWVDENDAPAPGNARSRRRLAAERGWLDLWRRHGVPVHIFRLAGIYGPGRNALETVRAGAARRIDKPGHLFSRIHVDDIVRILLASMAAPRPGAIYNVCDDEAAPPAEIVVHACRLLGVAPPPPQKFEAGAMSAMARSFWAENRRVRNGRVKRELGLQLRYPDYRAGLAALYAADFK